MITKFKKLLFFVTAMSGVASAQGVFSDLKATAALDILSPVYSSDHDGYKVDLRAAEFMLYSPVDHFFDGTINFAGHTEEGEFHWEIHEAYMGSTKLVPRSRFRVGKFFLGVGRLNQFHQHDWPFINAPKSHGEFFNDEAAADAGIEYTWLAPSETFIELTLGVTNGYCYGHCHDEGQKPPRPLIYLHPTVFFEGENGGTLVGLTILNRKDSANVETNLLGFDFTKKVRLGKVLRWLWQGELYFQHATRSGAESEKKIGGYFLPQYGINENWSASLRFDAYSELSKTFETTNESRGDFDYALVPTITFKSSEFSTFRLGYTFAVDTTGGEQDKRNHLVQLQYGFILGAHPAHDF